MLKIGFMTTLGVNVGDEFIREGIRFVLDGFSPAYAPLYVNKHDSKSLHEPYEDESGIYQDKYWQSDLFIQSGAPVYWHLHDGQSTSLTSEWHQWLWLDRILAKSEKPQPAFINLGAGSTFPFGDRGTNFVADPLCRQFAIESARRAMLTTVRDRVASDILREIGIEHRLMACPAFLAASRHTKPQYRKGSIGVNLMPFAGHGFGRKEFDPKVWRNKAIEVCQKLRSFGRLVFICHDRKEVEYASDFAQQTERVFFAPTWRSYLDIYSACEMVVANRVHGAVLAAGFGVPGIIIGSDTRALIGEPIGLSVFNERDLIPSDIVARSEGILLDRANLSQLLLKTQKRVLAEYRTILKPVMKNLVKISGQKTRNRGFAYLTDILQKYFL